MNDGSTCVCDNVTGNKISDKETTNKGARADEASLSRASDARDIEVLGFDTSDVQDDNYHDAIVPSRGKRIQKPLQSLNLDANSIPEKMLDARDNVSVVNDAKEKLMREGVRGGMGPFRSSHFETINCDTSALKKMILETEKKPRGSKVDTKNPKLVRGVKHTKETKTAGSSSIKKNLKSSSYSKASSIDKKLPFAGNGCPHSLFLHRKDDGNGQQALGAPKINTQLGKYLYNLSSTNKYIR